MIRHEFGHAQLAFSFIERLQSLDTPDRVLTEMEQALGLFGFENFILAGLPNPQESAEQMVLARKWPSGWFETYIKENYVAVDPVVRLCRKTINPFAWGEAPYDRDAEPRAHEVMNRAADFRMANGFCIPIHGLTGFEACVSFSGSHLDLTARTKPAIHLMGMYAFERIRQLMTPAQQNRSERLTEREREVLTWTALGKTSSEIAEILALSKRTVDEYSIRASRKLRALNKTHAVVKALQQRLINP